MTSLESLSVDDEDYVRSKSLAVDFEMIIKSKAYEEGSGEYDAGSYSVERSSYKQSTYGNAAPYRRSSLLVPFCICICHVFLVYRRLLLFC